MFTRKFFLLVFLSSCSIGSIDTSNIIFDGSFSSSDKFQFNKCLRGTNEKIELDNIELKHSAENINSQGLEFNARYSLSLVMKTENIENIELHSMRLDTTNYISSNMADAEKKEIKNLLITDMCKSIIEYVE